MFAFLRDLLRDRRRTQTVVVVDFEGGAARKYDVRPVRFAVIAGASLVLAVVATTLLLAFTPVKLLLPGFPGEEHRQLARLTDLRIAALEDSLATQHLYMRQLRYILTGEYDAGTAADPPSVPAADGPEDPYDSQAEASSDWADHLQPALPLARMPRTVDTPIELASSNPGGYLSALRLPVEPPTEGFATRHFDARRGHFGIDIAASVGSMVRSVGDGYVILADWTHDAGWIIALQHAAGYVSIYKHNQRLLKQVGDRVREREAIAVTGDSGLLTSGPHLHFELWHDGLAQDPSQFIVGY